MVFASGRDDNCELSSHGTAHQLAKSDLDIAKNMSKKASRIDETVGTADMGV